MNQNRNSMPCSFFLNGEPIDEIPRQAWERMTERLGRAVRDYFAEHPEEYVRFAAAQKEKGEGEA